MSLFARPHYQSDVTQFIESLRPPAPNSTPSSAGRALLSEQQVDADWNADANANRVKQQPYVTRPNLAALNPGAGLE